MKRTIAVVMLTFAVLFGAAAMTAQASEPETESCEYTGYIGDKSDGDKFTARLEFEDGKFRLYVDTDAGDGEITFTNSECT